METPPLRLYNLLTCPNTTETQKTHLQHLNALVQATEREWISSLKAAIDRWIGFIALKVKTQISNGSFAKGYDTHSQYIGEATKSVLKALKNVEKLYMIPQYAVGTHNKENQQGLTFSKKQRSISQGSNSSKGMFSNSRTKKIQAFPKNDSMLGTLTAKSNFISTATKNSFYIPKAKKTPLSKGFSTKPSFINHSDSGSKLDEDLCSRTLESFLMERKEKGTGMKQQIASEFNKKIGQLQSDLNHKMDLILTLVQEKAQTSSNARSERQQEIKSSKLNRFQPKIVRNEVREEDCFILDDISLPATQRAPAVNHQLQKKQVTFSDFISLTKKLKLPINESLIGILGAHYLSICQETKSVPKSEIEIELPNLNGSSRDPGYTMLIDNLNKLNKLVSLDCKADKKQKIQIYVKKCLQCVYCLVIRQKYEECGSVSEGIKKAVERLKG